MRRLWTILILVTVGVTCAAWALNYAYVSNLEVTIGQGRVKFWHGDTLNGPVRSNDMIAIMQDPVFYDFVITTAQDFWRGSGYNPRFFGPRPVFEAPRLPWPQGVDWYREQAVSQGHYFDGGDTMVARVRIDGDSLQLWWIRDGLPFDTANFSWHPLPDSAIVFFDVNRLNVWGTVGTTLLLCARGTIGLEDNVLYASSDPTQGRLTSNHPEKLALIAGGEVKVMNTWANGRENSRYGRDIAINGYVVALGESFTFEQQNDPDSGYVCTCQPDDRGTVYLWGGVVNTRRGLLHRSTRNSTGYLKQYHADPDLRHWDLHLFQVPENSVSRRVVDFGTVAVGADTVWDTVRVNNSFVPVALDSVRAGSPFLVRVREDTLRWEHLIRVGFAPQVVGQYDDALQFAIPSYGLRFEVPLAGVAVANGIDDPTPARPSSFRLAICPNPFNSRAVLSYEVPATGWVTLELYDVLGRKSRTLVNEPVTAGVHQVLLNADDLPSGIYFAHLATPTHSISQKLLLLK